MKEANGWIITGVAFGVLLTGCSQGPSAPDGTVHPSNEPWTTSPVIALDVSEQGQLKVAGLPGPGSIKALNRPNDRRVVLLGESFVRRHGLISTKWDLPPETLAKLGGRPIVALAGGDAGLWVRQPLAEAWLRELQRKDEQLRGFSRYADGRMKDRVVPFVDGIPSSSTSSKGEVQIKAAAMSGRSPGLILSERQLQMLACLDGQAGISVAGNPATTLSCRVQWRSNGELKAPKLLSLVEVISPSVRREDTAYLRDELARLIRLMQSHRTDPLDIGHSVRSQYRGMWTPERWRDAFERAQVQVEVRMSAP